jgi:hypothetical protein
MWPMLLTTSLFIKITWGKKVRETMILLDNQSTHSTFYVRAVVSTVCPAVFLIQMQANSRSLTYTKWGDLPGYGPVWFNPFGTANILSMSKAESKGHTVPYMPGKFTLTNAFTSQVTSFVQTPEGL